MTMDDFLLSFVEPENSGLDPELKEELEVLVDFYSDMIMAGDPRVASMICTDLDGMDLSAEKRMAACDYLEKLGVSGL